MNHDRRLWLLAAVAIAIGVLLRVHNAIHYRMVMGFDASPNWQYIKMLLDSWALPAPDAGWSTAHPPLFYYLSAAVTRAIGEPGRSSSVITLRLLSTAIGLIPIGLVFHLLRRLEPQNLQRALLAGALILFLPVHIYLSAMLSEEILTMTLISIVLVGVALDTSEAHESRHPLRLATWLGLAAGLAFLTKLTGVLVIIAAAGAYLLAGWRRNGVIEAMPKVAVLVGVASLVGGWFYVHSLVSYGYLYPHGLSTHEIMFEMPPGDRQILDYFRLPLATIADPQILNPDLLRSIWGGTWVTMWFDGHRHFLPTESSDVTRAGRAIIALSIVPMSAFAIGLRRGVLRAWASWRGPDTILVGIVALTLAGFVLFTWKNPWFAVVKASFMLGLCIPFAFYTSEVLDEWLTASRARAIPVACALVLLVLLVTVTFTISETLWPTAHMKGPGVIWRGRF